MLKLKVGLVGLLVSLSVAGVARAESLTWKSVLLTGDDSITAFDNARKEIKSQLLSRGLTSQNIRELSVNPDEAIGDVLPTTLENIAQSLDKLAVRSGDACLYHMTSHGSPRGFFYIKPETALTPRILNKMLDMTCGDQPTVVLVSACFSGVFAEPEMQRPNRIILTAARSDRPSFGCAPDEVYTYWDGCLIENMPNARDWQGLYDSVKACVTEKEIALAKKQAAEFGAPKIKPSYPQAFFGSEVRNLELPR